jgi:FkbM family methyltransferase
MGKPAVVLEGLEDLLRLDPLVLVDVGARGGILDRWRHVEPWLRTVGFEPDARSLDTVERSERSTVLHTALGSEPGSLDLHLTAEESHSSVLPPNRAFLSRFPQVGRFDVVETRTVEADTLDVQLDRAEIGRVDFIKLDTQGSELMVLQGAQKTLGRGVIGIEVEVELNPLYEEQPLLADVDRFLRPFGYELFDLAQPRRWRYRGGEELALARGQIIWTDAVYLLGPEHMLPLLRRADDAGPDLARFVVICLLYDLGDYALALLDSLGNDVGRPLRDRLERAVHIYDTTSKTGRHTLTTRVSARDRRRVRALRDRTGISAPEQLRAALGAWLDAREQAPGLLDPGE